MNNYKIKFKNGRTTTICCSSNEELKSDLIECTKRFNSEIATINDMPTEKLSVGGFLLGTILGGILGNAVAKSGVKKTAKTISKTTKKTISKTKKGVSEFRSASSKSKKMSAGGLGKPTYIPNEDIESLKTNYGQTISGRKLLDGAYATGKVKKPTMSRTQFEDESYEYAKGGNVPSITRKVNEVNRLIALGNENDISVIDSSSTWESPMKYKPIKYSNGTLYIEYEELDLYKNNRTGVKQWITKKDKVLKRNMEYDSPLNDIAKWYRKALRNYDVMFENGGMSSMALAGASPQLAIADQISQRLPATTSAVDKRIAERIYSDRPSMWEDRGLKHYGNGGSANSYNGKNAEEVWNNWNINQREHFLSDHNVTISSTMDKRIRLYRFDELPPDLVDTITYKLKEHIARGSYAKGGMVGQTITFKHWSGDTKNGTITEDLGDGNFQVSSGFGNVLVNQEDIISSGTKSPERKKMFGFFKNGGVGGNNNLQQKIDYINNNYNGVVASKTYSDNRIQVVSRYFNTLNEIKRKEFNGSGLLEKYGNLSSYVLYSNQKFAGGGSTDEERYPRLADDTGKGIREGFVIGDGDYYYENEDNLVKHLRSLDYEDADGNSSKDIESDEDLKEFFYNDEYYYFTEWEEDEIEDQGYYYTRDGKEIEIASKGKKISVGDLILIKCDSSKMGKITFAVAKSELNKIPDTSKSSLEDKAKEFVYEMTERNNYIQYYFKRIITNPTQVYHYLKGHSHTQYHIIPSPSKDGSFSVMEGLMKFSGGGSTTEKPYTFTNDPIFIKGKISIQRVGGSTMWNVAINQKPMGRILDAPTKELAFKKAETEIKKFSGGGLAKVYEVGIDKGDEGTHTIADFDSEPDAKKFMYDYQLRHPKAKLFIDSVTSDFLNSQQKFSGGGSTNSRMDLFVDYENIPPEVQKILDKYTEEFGDDLGDMSYKDMADMHDEIYAVGYTFESYLDNVPYGLRPVGVNLNELQGFEEEPDDDKE